MCKRDGYKRVFTRKNHPQTAPQSYPGGGAMPGVHRRRLAATSQAMLLSTWEQLCGHFTSIQESRLTSRTDGCQPLPSGAMTSTKLQGRRPVPVEMDRTCRAETQRNAALTLIGRFLKIGEKIGGRAQHTVVFIPEP